MEEALICDKEVEDGVLLAESREVIVAEEDGELSVFHHRVKLADPERDWTVLRGGQAECCTRDMSVDWRTPPGTARPGETWRPPPGPQRTCP